LLSCWDFCNYADHLSDHWQDAQDSYAKRIREKEESVRTLAVFGDSVTWGQGLVAEHKFSGLVQQWLAANGVVLTLNMVAHSGATIGIRGPNITERIPGEVQVAAPTITEQIATYDADPNEVDLVIINGGINDIDFRIILSPLTSTSLLTQKVKQYCYEDMLSLLKQTTLRFPAARKIVVTGYYPVLSQESDPFRIPFLLEHHAIGMPFFVDPPKVFSKIVKNALLFWKESTTQLQRAVDAANQVNGASRVFFAVAPFTEANALFTTAPWLFGLDGGFAPQDEVIDARHAVCDLYVQDIDVLDREICYRASVGHPNLEGANEYAKAILTALNDGKV